MKKIFLVMCFVSLFVFLFGCNNTIQNDFVGIWEPSIGYGENGTLFDYSGYHHLIINEDGTYSKRAFVDKIGWGLYFEADDLNDYEKGRYTFENDIIYFEYFDSDSKYNYDFRFDGDYIFNGTYYSDGTLNEITSQYVKINTDELLSLYIGEWVLDENKHTNIELNDYSKYSTLQINNDTYSLGSEYVDFKMLISSNCVYISGKIENIYRAYSNLKIELINENSLLISGDYFERKIEIYYIKIN